MSKRKLPKIYSFRGSGKVIKDYREIMLEEPFLEPASYTISLEDHKRVCYIYDEFILGNFDLTLNEFVTAYFITKDVFLLIYKHDKFPENYKEVDEFKKFVSHLNKEQATLTKITIHSNIASKKISITDMEILKKLIFPIIKTGNSFQLPISFESYRIRMLTQSARFLFNFLKKYLTSKSILSDNKIKLVVGHLLVQVGFLPNELEYLAKHASTTNYKKYDVFLIKNISTLFVNASKKNQKN